MRGKMASGASGLRFVCSALLFCFALCLACQGSVPSKSAGSVAGSAGAGGFAGSDNDAGAVGLGGAGGCVPGPLATPGTGGARFDCSSVCCAATPQCGESCDALCGCCGCKKGEIRGQTVCNGTCFEPLKDGGAMCDARTSPECAVGYMNGSEGVCDPERFEATCVNGAWECVGGIPAASCTTTRCHSLPIGACVAGDRFSCSGYVYPFVNADCICQDANWSCAL